LPRSAFAEHQAGLACAADVVLGDLAALLSWLALSARSPAPSAAAPSWPDAPEVQRLALVPDRNGQEHLVPAYSAFRYRTNPR
jgi:hypothetical protein